VVLAGAGFYLSDWVAAGGMQPVLWMLVVVGAFIPFREFARRVCFARLQMKAALVMDGCVALSLASGLFLLAYLGKLSASRAFGVIGLGCGLAGLAWFFWARRSLAFSLKQAVLDLSHNWSFGKKILFGNTAVFFSYQLSYWFLALFHGTAEVGLLAACQSVIALSNPIMLGSGLFLKVKAAHAFTQGGTGRLRGLVIKSTMVIALSMSLFCVAIMVIGDRLVTILYGVHYAGHSLLLAILAISVLVSFVQYGIYCGLLAMEKTEIIFSIYLLHAGITLTIGLWLIHTWGPLGAALGYLIAELASLIAQGLVFTKTFYLAEDPGKV
jgi:O-antigen/teichoic acid export membrane protein